MTPRRWTLLLLLLTVVGIVALVRYNSDDARDRRVWERLRAQLPQVTDIGITGPAQPPLTETERQQVIQFLQVARFDRSNRMGHMRRNPPPPGAPPSHSAFGHAVATAAESGILPPPEVSAALDLAADLTRSVLGLWVGRALGYGALAGADLAVQAPWPDAGDLPDAVRRSAAFLAALGVLPWRGGRFDGDAPMTLGEAAALLSDLRQRGSLM